MRRKLATLKKISKKQFESKGYNTLQTKIVNSLINWKFTFIFEIDGERLAYQILESNNIPNEISSLIPMASVIPNKIKIVLGFPEEVQIPSSLLASLSEENVDIYSIRQNNLVDITSRDPILQQNKIDKLRSNMHSFNIIVSGKLGYKFFKCKNSLFKQLKIRCKDKDDFVIHIASIGSLIEDVFIKEFKQALENKISLSVTEKKIFKGKNSITVLQFIFQKFHVNDSKAKNIIKNFRELNAIRNKVTPLHPYEEREVKNIYKKWTNKSTMDWDEFGKLALDKFCSSMLILKEIFKNIKVK